MTYPAGTPMPMLVSTHLVDMHHKSGTLPSSSHGFIFVPNGVNKIALYFWSDGVITYEPTRRPWPAPVSGMSGNPDYPTRTEVINRIEEVKLTEHAWVIAQLNELHKNRSNIQPVEGDLEVEIIPSASIMGDELVFFHNCGGLIVHDVLPQDTWPVLETKPLTIQGKISCKTCGISGYINQEKWVQQ